MGGRNERAEAIIALVGEDGLTELTKQIQRSLDGVAAKATAAGKATGQMSAGLLTSTQHTALLTAGFGSLLGIASRVAGVVTGIPATLEEAGRSRAIQSAFDGLFEGAAKFRTDLQAATGGQLDVTNLERLATHASRAGLSMSQITDTMRLAIQTANATGRDNVETADAFLKSLTAATDEAFKSVGLHLDLERVFGEQAAALGVSTAELGAARKQAIVLEEASRQVAANFGDVALNGTAIADARKLESTLANINDTWGRMKSEVIGAGLVMVGALDNSAEAMDRATRGMQGYLGLLRQKGIDEGVHAALVKDLIGFVTENDLALQALNGQLEREARNYAQVAVALGAVGDEKEAFAAKTRQLRQELGLESFYVDGLIGRYRDLKSAMHAAVAVESAFRAVAGGADERPSIDASAKGLGGKMAVGRVGKGGGGRRGSADPSGLADFLASSSPHALFVQGQEQMAAAEAAIMAQREADAAEVAERIAASLNAYHEGQIASLVAQADAVRALKDEYASLIGQDFAGGFEGVGKTIGQTALAFSMAKKTGADMGGTMLAMTPKLVAAGADMAAGFVADERGKAGLMAVVETARSISDFASFNYVGGAGHAAAAIQYGLIASGALGGSGGGGGGGGGSRGGGRSAPSIPSIGPTTPQTGRESGQAINIYLDGATMIGGNLQQAGRDLAHSIQGEMARRSSSRPNFLPV